MITIKTKLGNASIDGFEWSSDDKIFQDILNEQLPIFGPSGSSPNPDLEQAESAIKLFGGQIVSINQEKGEAPDNAIF